AFGRGRRVDADYDPPRRRARPFLAATLDQRTAPQSAFDLVDQLAVEFPDARAASGRTRLASRARSAAEYARRCRQCSRASPGSRRAGRRAAAAAAAPRAAW